MNERPQPSDLDELTRRQLAEAFAEPEFREDRVLDRLHASIEQRRHRRPVLTRVFATAALAATVLVTFIGGTEYGRRLPPPSRSAAGPVAPADLPLAIQSAGTEYITAVSQFADLRDSLDSAERAQAREAALAVLYGVVVELMRLEAGDAEFARVIQAAMARQRAAAEAVLWF
jgi:hypothetical protein